MFDDFLKECAQRYGASTASWVERMVRKLINDPSTEIELSARPDHTVVVSTRPSPRYVTHQAAADRETLHVRLPDHNNPEWLHQALLTVRDIIIKENQKPKGYIGPRKYYKDLAPHEYRVKPAKVTVTLPGGMPGTMTFKPQPEMTAYEFHCCTTLMAGRVEGNQLAYATEMNILHHFDVQEYIAPDYTGDAYERALKYEHMPYGQRYTLDPEKLRYCDPLVYDPTLEVKRPGAVISLQDGMDMSAYQAFLKAQMTAALAVANPRMVKPEIYGWDEGIEECPKDKPPEKT